MVNDTERRAAADVVRMAEPGDVLLAALVRERGFEEARALALSRDEGEQRRAAAAIAGALVPEGTDATTVRARTAEAHSRWQLREDELDADRDLRIMARLGGRLVLPGDGEWPQGVDALGTAAPVALWVRGPAPLAAALERAVAIVGSRAADSYGLTVTRQLAWDLSAAGYTVVSGGAYGVDAAAHRAALGAEAPTVAFMAGGADVPYPQGNAELLGAVVRSGAIVSEAAPGRTAMRHRFLLRNRLIAAAAGATVVTAASRRSGALHTANRAAELLRPVGAVPGSVMTDQSAGCHRLIQEGAAVLVSSSDDVLALAGTLSEAMEHEAAVGGDGAQGELRITDGMGPEELQVYSSLPVRRGVDVPTVAARAGLGLPAAMSALAALEMSGRARRSAEGWSKE